MRVCVRECGGGGGWGVRGRGNMGYINPVLNYCHYCNDFVMFAFRGPIIVTKPGVQSAGGQTAPAERQNQGGEMGAPLSMIAGLGLH